MKKEIRTSEFVTPSHPDKVCDQIADSILDECLKQDKNSRVAVEVMGGHGKLNITGEITTTAKVNYEKKALKVCKENGYGKVAVEVNISKQSPEISKGITEGGAGDQGIMIGYACRENKSFIPQEHYLARDLSRLLYERHKKDGKTQITIYGRKVKIIVASMADVSGENLKKMIKEWSKQSRFKEFDFANCKIVTNPAGDWSKSGFEADTGLTGRKIVIDSYGPRVPVGGGCFSGKDPTKVDRSGAYMARKIALDYLRNKKASEVFVKLAYVIGKKEPVMKTVQFDSNREEISGYDLTPEGIVRCLDLKKPIYKELSRFGHFGRKGLPWEF